MLERLAIPHAADPRSGVLTISAAITALLSVEEKNADALLRAVDGVLYPAKDPGRNRVAVDEALALTVGVVGC